MQGKKNDDLKQFWEGKYASKYEWYESQDYKEWQKKRREEINAVIDSLFPEDARQQCRTRYELHCIYKTFHEIEDIYTGCTKNSDRSTGCTDEGQTGYDRHEVGICSLANLEAGYEMMKKCRSQVVNLHDNLTKYLVKEYCIISYDWNDFENKRLSENRYEHFYPLHFTIVHADMYGTELSEEGDFTDYKKALKERDRLNKTSNDFLTVEVKDWYCEK